MTDNNNMIMDVAPPEPAPERPYFHRGKWYFMRAFVTTFGILTAVSAFIAAWILIWALTLGGLYGIGQNIDEPAGDETSQPVETPTYTGVEPSCDPDYDEC